MQGHIRKRGLGYQIIVDLGRDPISKKRKQKAKGGFKTKKEAQKALVEMITKLEKGEFFEEKNILLQDYLEKWLATYAKHNVSESTFEFYKNIVNRVLIPSLGSASISKLRPVHIQEFLSKVLETKKISKTTVRHYYTVLNIALNQAVKWEILQTNPCSTVEPPKKNEKQLNVLNHNQAMELLTYTKTSLFSVMYIPLVLALFCGLRRGEILGLRWSNVDFERQLIRIRDNVIRIGNGTVMTTPKTDQSVRTVVMNKLAIIELQEHKENQEENSNLLGDGYHKNDFLCTWPDGRTLRPDYVTHTLKKLLRAIDLPDIRFHNLRHTHATFLLLQGVNPKIVSEQLGHSKVDITLDTYSHVLPEMQKEAAAKLEDLFIKKD